MQPTDKQKQFVLEHCRFKLRCPPEKDAYKRGIWDYPDGMIGDVDLDLNNLGKYTFPILLKKIGKKGLVALVNKAICDAVEANLYGQEGIPDHLFWAIYKAFGGKDADGN